MNLQAIAGSENCLPIGTRLHDFEITGVLGEGGFGIVYIAFDHSLQRNVAIKEYMPGVLATRADDHSILVRAERHQETFNVGLKSFINEARFLAQFDHTSLVKVYRFWEQNQTAYTAMQYYDGQTVKDIVNHAPEVVSEAWCLKMLQQILEALEMLYTMRILHRDVSPDNIIVQEDGDAVLLDFGSARQIIGDRTRGLTVILKPGYAPVEQYAGDASLDQGAYTDIYSLSAVIYFAIMKEPPATSIARMVKDPIVPLAQRGVEGYSTQFLAAIDQGLAVMAHERPQTIDAFRELLGIKSSGAPRARPSGNTQRFATLERAPNSAVTAAPVTGQAGKTARVTTGKGASGPLSTPTQSQSPTSAPSPGKAAILHKTAPTWMSRAALAVAMLVIIGYSAKWLLGTPTDVFMPATQLETVVLPDAGPALPDAAAAPSAVEPDAAPAAPDPGTSAENIIPAAAEIPESAQASEAAMEPVLVEGAPVDVGIPAAPAMAPVTAPVTASVTAAPVVDEKPGTATYRLLIKPWGTVYVDGKEKGVTPPLKRLVLAAGKHRIRVVNPSFPDHNVEVNLARNKSGTIEHDFAARPK